MNKKVENLEGVIDKHERYSRQNCFLFHGIVETANVAVNSSVIETISTKMNIEVSSVDLDRMHRIRKKKAGQNKLRPIIVNLSRCNVRKKIFSEKNTLEESDISIMESLTAKRMEILKKAKLKHWFTNTWASHGKILYKNSTENKVNLYHK